MVYSRLRLWALGAILFSLVGHLLPASAQKTTVPTSMLAPSTDKRVIASQLRMAAGLGRKTLAGLQAAPRHDSIPLDEDVIQGAKNTYAMIRAARHGLWLFIGNQKFPDPVDQLNFKKLDDAWNLSRYPVDRLTWAMVREEYLTISVRDLSRALKLVDQVLILLP